VALLERQLGPGTFELEGDAVDLAREGEALLARVALADGGHLVDADVERLDAEPARHLLR